MAKFNFKYDTNLENDSDFMWEAGHIMHNIEKFGNAVNTFLGETLTPFDITKMDVFDVCRIWFNNSIWNVDYRLNNEDINFQIEVGESTISVGYFGHRSYCDGWDCERQACGVFGQHVDCDEQPLTPCGFESFNEVRQHRDIEQELLNMVDTPPVTTFWSLNTTPVGRSFVAAVTARYNQQLAAGMF